MTTASKNDEVRTLLDQLASSARSADKLMKQMVQLLHERMPMFNWVGFYMIEKVPAGRLPCWCLGTSKAHPPRIRAFR